MAKTNYYGKKNDSKENELSFVNQEQDSFKGFEDINTSTMAIPFIKVLQLLSPELNKAKPCYNKDAKEGDFFNTVTKEIYGTEICAIILKFDRIFIEWLPDRRGLAGYHTLQEAELLAVNPDKFGAWLTPDGNILQETYVYYAIIQDHENEGVVVISLTSSGIKVAKKLNRLLVTHIMDNGQRAFPYYLVWKLSTEYIENDKGNWYTINVDFEKYINEKQYNLILKERKLLPEKKLDLSNQEQEDLKEDTPF